MRRKPAEFRQSSLTAGAKCPRKGHSYMWRPPLEHTLCPPCWGTPAVLRGGFSSFLDKVGLEAEQGSRRSVGRHLPLFLPSPSPRINAHCARNNIKTEASPQRLQCPMDTDPPQEIRRRFGKKYGCFAPKVNAPSTTHDIVLSTLLYRQISTPCPRTTVPY